MRWATFLHFYQPAKQQPDILEMVVTQSYRPLFSFFAKNPKARLTINLNAALLELFDRSDYRDLLDALRKAYRAGSLEFTGTPKYHVILPFLDSNEIVRQINLNTATFKYYFGKSFSAQGFFPTEMAYHEKVGPLVESLGYRWIILDEIAHGGTVGNVDYAKQYRLSGTNLAVFFRERRPSNLIMSAVTRKQSSLLDALRGDTASERYLVTAMDGETFGHHRPGLDQLLFKLLVSNKYKVVQVSDLLGNYPEGPVIRPARCTWASSEQDIKRGVQFLSWSDPANLIHTWQWKLLRLALREVHAVNKKHSRFPAIRKQMDIALASDHFWWASAKPWWSLEMIEDGAFQLLTIVRSIPGISAGKKSFAVQCYEMILSTACEWQRSGRIRKMASEQLSVKRIPFRDRTIGRGGPERGVWDAFLTMIKTLERKAAKNGEYEKAILWRDAIIKLKNRSEIYDLLNVIDLVRMEIPHPAVERTIERYKNKYRKIRGGQPEQRGA